MSHTSHARKALALVIVAGSIMTLAPVQQARAIIVNSSGAYVNSLIGADKYYTNGYDGTGIVVGNIEGALGNTSHETLVGKVAQTFVSTGALNQFADHPTATSFSAAGNGTTNTKKGIAYGATLWEGTFNAAAAGGNYSFTSTQLNQAYIKFMATGYSGVKADVTNSSWGGNNPGSSPQQNGYDTSTIAIDALAQQNRRLVVISAGNDGPTTGSVGAPGIGYNNLSVGALQYNTGTGKYDSIASFSSRGPQTFYNAATNTNIAGVRAPVDISAPGQDLVLPTYPGNTSYSTWAGTSFSAPITAGGSALLVQAAKANNMGDVVSGAERRGTDPRVLKAILMNSADKPTGWTNNATTISGVHTTTQGIDWTYGAGMLNLSKAYDQQFALTRDVSGTGGGSIAPAGWDYGATLGFGFNTYNFATTLSAGAKLTASLSWFSDDIFTYDASGNMLTMDRGLITNLNLELWRGVNTTTGTKVAESKSTYNVNEEIYFDLPATDNYFLVVRSGGTVYDKYGSFNSVYSTPYGLAWTVPTPSVTGLLGLAGVVAARRRRA